MRFYRSFQVSTYLMVLLGLLTLTLAEAELASGSTTFLGIAVVGTAAAWFLTERLRWISLGRTSGAIITLGAFLLTLAEGLREVDFLLPFAHWLVLLQIIKLFQRKTNRDYAQIYLISLVHMAAAAVLTVRVEFGLVFLVYLLVGVWTLILFHLKQEGERLDPDCDEAAPDVRSPMLAARPALGGGMFGIISLYCLQAMVYMSILFLVFPRVGKGFGSALTDLRGRTGLSGFSEEVSLGDVSEIRLDGSPAMRVQLLDPARPGAVRPYWRGTTHNIYQEGDGDWSRESRPLAAVAAYASRDGSVRLDRHPRAVPRREFPTHPLRRRIDHRSALTDRPDSEQVRALYVLEPQSSRILFALPEVVGVDLTPGRVTERPRHMSIMPNGDLRRRGVDGRQYSYECISVVAQPSSETRAGLRSTNSEMAGPFAPMDYLQVPEGMRGVLDGVAEDMVGDIQRTEGDWAAVAAIERNLRRDWAYTLEPGRPGPGEDAVVRFLTDTRRGHCELFASSMVLLCRSRGMPARLASGYAWGEWVDRGGYWLVRRSDAHAWVEVWFDGVGWMTFDPTPDAGRPQPPNAGMLAGLTQFWDALQFQWTLYVIDYDVNDQVSALRDARTAGRDLGAWFRDTAGAVGAWARAAVLRVEEALAAAVGRWGARLLMALMATALVVGPVLWLRRRRRRGGAAFWSVLADLLRRRGWERRPAETPIEFAGRVAAEEDGAVAAAVRRIAAIHGRVVYGGAELDPDTASAVHADLRRVREAGRRT